MTGADPQKAIDAISKKMMTSKYNAGRLVMTEEAYFNSLSQGDMFKELDVEKYEIVATLDSHTSEICQDVDGKVFPMSEYESGVTAPPFHVYCRSTTAPWFPEDYGVKGERAARDTDDDKTYHVPANMSYDDWYKKFVENDDKSDLKTEPDDGTIKVTRDYDSSMAKSFGKKHYDAMRDLVDKCKNKTLAKLWDKYESQITVRSANYKKTAHCSGTNISLDIEADAKGSSYEMPYEVAFHESGHALDHLFRLTYEPRMLLHFSALYENGKFPTMIRDEISTLVDGKAAIIKQEWKDHAGDWKWLHDRGYIDKWSYGFYERNGSWLGREPKYAKSMAYKAVENEIRALNPQQKANLSDIMEGATGAKINVGYGHGKTYWSKGLGKDDHLATEAFAEMTAATMTNLESLETIKKYLPKSYEIYEEMLEWMAKN
jgi:SPP1 gp7 family putative phage head morphogenesis protein